MHLDDNNRIIWIATVNYWSGEILDLEIKVVDKTLVLGNMGNGDGTVDVSIYPEKSEYEECGFDKRRVIDAIKIRHEREILKSIYAERLLYAGILGNCRLRGLLMGGLADGIY